LPLLSRSFFPSPLLSTHFTLPPAGRSSPSTSPLTFFVLVLVLALVLILLLHLLHSTLPPLWHPTKGPNSIPIPSPWIAGHRRRVTHRIQRRYRQQQQLDQANPEQPDQEQPGEARPGGADLLQRGPLHKDPILDPANLNVHDPALPSPDAELIENFRRNLARDQFEECSRCQRKWFNLRVIDGVCANCTRVGRKKKPDEPYLFSAENLADPGPFPQPTEGPLPELTQFEEMLIARVHTYMEIRQHRGQ